MLKNGIEEIIVIAQDTTKYGLDLYGKPRLVELLNKLSKIDSIKWIRFLYAYPESISDSLIQEVKNNPKLCNYFDIPIQHISDNILKKMNRKSNGNTIRELIAKIRKEIPDVILRTSLIVGFPSETENDFEMLYEFVENAEFDKLGVFQYSKEDGTAAEKLPEQVHGSTKKRRWRKIMELQQKVSINKIKEKIGKSFTVLIESKTDDGKYFVGRSYMDVPEMDGTIFIKFDNCLDIGMFVDCNIIDINGDYDLIAEKK